MKQHSPHPTSIAVIDIGSNSIKSLVATRRPDDSIEELASRALEVRLGTGLSKNPPQLNSDGIDRAIEAAMTLQDEAKSLMPDEIRIVATSAVRDAANGKEFVRRYLERSGRTIDVLSSKEEARLIGCGIVCDPGLPRTKDFSLFDLGGGSVEMLAFQENDVVELANAPLGCVRLSEQFVSDTSRAVPADEIANLRKHVGNVLTGSGFSFAPNGTGSAVLTGGTAITLRAVRAAANQTTFEQTRPTITTDELESWARSVSNMNLEERRTIPGLSDQRSDVFPAALWTLVELAQVAGVRQFYHSLYNLRFGVAAELLGISETRND